MKVIIALGNTAIQSLTNTPLGVTKLRGTFLKYKQTPVLCAFHPSAILRAGGIGSKMYETFKQDIQLAINKSTEPNQPKKEQNT
jgi:uracil-DNA glycosylase family 4